MKDFQDRVAVVTGAASGIGRGMAERFAAEGISSRLRATSPLPAFASSSVNLRAGS